MSPADLHNHDCIRLRWVHDGQITHWDLGHLDGSKADMAVSGPLIVNDMHLVLRSVLSGVGIGYLAEPMLRDYLADGRLVRLLDGWSGYRSGLFLYYPSRRQIPRPLQVFIDFVERNRQQIAEQAALHA